jgi:hypothetical protein
MSTLPSPNDLRAEYLKIRTLRLPALALVAGILFSGAIGVGGVLMQKAGATVDVTQAGRAVTAPMWFLVAVVAILASAGEFQHHTIRTTLLTTPVAPTCSSPRPWSPGATGQP